MIMTRQEKIIMTMWKMTYIKTKIIAQRRDDDNDQALDCNDDDTVEDDLHPGRQQPEVRR